MENKKLSGQQFVSWVMWFAFLGAVIVDGLIVHFTTGASQGLESVNAIFKNILYGISILAAIISVFVVDRLFKYKLSQLPEEIQMDKDKLRIMYGPFFIIKLAMAESIAIYGLVLSFMGSEKMNVYLPFGIFSFLVLLINRPKEIN